MTSRFFITALLLIVAKPSFSQSVNLLQQFDKIPLGGQKYELIGYMSNHESFGMEEKEYEFIYKGHSSKSYANDTVRVVLDFQEGVLYRKVLKFKYPISQMDYAKSQYLKTQNYLRANNKWLTVYTGTISNEAFGGDIGESVTFNLTKSIKKTNHKEAIFEATLDFKYNEYSKVTTATVIGYEVCVESVDLTKTSLDAQKGYTATQ
ncbi:hypothetical protein DYU05_15355 [Mucilaginibacter terrenus]|uniref:DUF3108 domain-containing protein n=1 Tax=Mucilaginibacter terrenus TaxID=2482727 RepID=A0A3E2NLX9_9SPHI|nr:hypothetical protein [Mucilaginibacter terrenus]RFZ82005.1 hypothetical protein DYU05_15355 [Mucilaginibacter terrenus]